MAFIKPAGGLLSLRNPVFMRPQIRAFANLVEGQTPQAQLRQRSTPPSYDTANFTIRNGPVFNGKSFGAKSNVSGEAVFTTSLDVALQYSHWTAVESLASWCAREGVPAISGVDTRAIVTYLREQGSSLAKITVGEEYDEEQDEAFVDPEGIHLVRKVSTKAPFHVSSSNGDMHVALIDCGVKENILRSLASRGCSVTCFPYDYPVHKVAHHFDGIFISNGPGDPTHCQETVHTVRTLINSSQIPVMGICLGHQIVGLSIGAKTTKLKLNDSSNEGIIHKSRPIFSTQFHPEARGGPLDSSYLFDKYLESVAMYKKNQALFQPNRDNKPSPLLKDLLAHERVGVAPTLGMENMARINGGEVAQAAGAV
ncbi:hypothetical protein P7C71_g2674, partial [Lecanoromycetidae sp. Uapishka_2]